MKPNFKTFGPSPAVCQESYEKICEEVEDTESAVVEAIARCGTLDIFCEPADRKDDWYGDTFRETGNWEFARWCHGWHRRRAHERF